MLLQWKLTAIAHLTNLHECKHFLGHVDLADFVSALDVVALGNERVDEHKVGRLELEILSDVLQNLFPSFWFQ